MKISMLVENENTNSISGLQSEHGLSIHIELNEKSILFDTGSSGVFIENAEKLGINIEMVDIVVISHAHRDHSGGLKRFLERNKKAKVYVSSLVDRKYFLSLLGFKFDISFPKEVLHEYTDRIVFVDSSCSIGKGLMLITSIEQRHRLVSSSKNLLVKNNDSYDNDSFDHELIFVAEENENVVIFTGCSHNGILNMIEAVKKFYPNNKIKAVVGGMHLMGVPFKNTLGEPEDYVKELANKLYNYQISSFYTCHCTGRKAFNILKDIIGADMKYMNTGIQIEI